MSAQKVDIFVAGSAIWATPVRLGPDTLRTPYQASLMNRFCFADGQVHYLKLHMIGIDEINNEGMVVTGNGTMQFQDADGDLLRGESDWFLPEGPDERGRTPENLGTMTFSSGTGKWSGTTGTAELRCYGMYAALDQPLPPADDTKYFAIFEGTGELDAPGLAG
jgi:hypothetical protein